MSATNTNAERIETQDGKALSYSEYGDSTGVPVLFFHGFPGSRIEGRLLGDTAARLGIRLVAPDRPGMGSSDYQPGRRITDWPADVLALTNALSIERFAVCGLSGGGPYAAACARLIPERLTSVGLVASIGPPEAPTAGMRASNRVIFAIARRLPPLVRASLWVTSRLARWNPEFIERSAEALPEPDRKAYDRPGVSELFRADFLEAFRAGTRGPAHEATLIARPWDFSLSDIPIAVHLWQGTRDINVSPAMGRYLADAIPTCQATFLAREGHVSLVTNYAEEILRTLRDHV